MSKGRAVQFGVLVLTTLAMTFAGGAVGCAGPSLDASSRLSIGDMQLIVDDTVQAFAASDWIGDRGPNSERAVISVQRMVNASDDVITPSELWYLAQAVSAEVFRSRVLREEKNVTIVIPSSRLEDAKRRGAVTGRSGADRQVTHTMVGRINNAARSESGGRTDLYVAEYTLVNVGTGDIEWIGRVRFERRALGRSFN